MIPIALDPQHIRVAVAGNGGQALRRLQALRAAGAGQAMLFADAPESGLAAAAGAYLRNRLPDDRDLASLHAVWIAGLPADIAEGLTIAARQARVLVNVEDRTALCDFHSVAEIRRKDLLLTVSTGAAAPGLAGSIRRRLEACFGPEWAERVDEVAALRAGWRAEGLPMAEAARRIDTLVAERCWLPCPNTH